MIIKNARVVVIIGVEGEAMTGNVHHTLDMVINAVGIDPKDFENLKRSGTVTLQVD